MAGSRAGVVRELSATKRGLGIDVLTAARHRVRRVLTDFPNVYVSFSGGKDSGVLLELAAVEARARGRRIGVLIVDLEAQYTHTIDYLKVMLDRHADVLEVFWIALPLNLRNAVSQFQPQWQCWDPAAVERWVRPAPPEAITDPAYFDFFTPGMEFEDFVARFGAWYAARGHGRLTACLVAIRADESLNRYRTIASTRKKTHEGLAWTTWIGQAGVTYNAYPIYDWRTEDVWRFYGREKVPYNAIYDLMHQAGVSIHQARLCQPYGDDQRKGLWLYHVCEPATWSRVVARVQGANFGARYSRETGNIMGRVKVDKPESMTWEQFAKFLLASMPKETAEHFRDKIAVFINWHAVRGYHGGVIPDHGPLDKIHPSWRRITKVLLSYDYWCKGLSFSPPGNSANYEAHKARMRIKRQEWGFSDL